MKFKKAELAKLSLADLKVLSDESEKQINNFSDGTPERTYHTHLVEALAAEKSDRIASLVDKDDDEKTDSEKEADKPAGKK